MQERWESARLAHCKTHIVSLIAEIEAKPAEIDCATNAKRVLSRIRKGEIVSPIPDERNVCR